MSPVDQLFERGAARLEELSNRTSHPKLAAELRDDADFLRKLKPSLIVERVRGEQHASGNGGATVVNEQPPAAAGPRPKARSGGGPNPFVVVAAAFAVGMLLAKVIDWRSVAHPRW